MNNAILPNANLSTLAGNVIGEAMANDYNSITEAEVATATAGADIINSFTDSASRLSAQKSKYEHDEKQTETREKNKTARCAIIGAYVLIGVGLIFAIPAYIKSAASA